MKVQDNRTKKIGLHVNQLVKGKVYMWKDETCYERGPYIVTDDNFAVNLETGSSSRLDPTWPACFFEIDATVTLN